MATLNAPTGLQVQLLEPLITFRKTVQRIEPAQTLITFNKVVVPAGSVYRPAQTLITFRKRVTYLLDSPAQTLITFRKTVTREEPARTLIRFRKIVRTPASVAPGQPLLEPPLLVYLDGVDITGRCAHEATITATEGNPRTCQVIYRPPPGPIDIPSFQGRSLELVRLQDGKALREFTGVVDMPVYQRLPSRVTLNGTDLREERLGRESRTRLRQLTGGLYSPITQREDAERDDWVRELMRTVPGSLDYTGAGTLRYRPWAVGTPRYNLQPGDLNHVEPRFEFSTRREIVNLVRARLEYRYYQRNTFDHSVQIGMRSDGRGLPRIGDTIPTRDALRSALNISGWHVASYQMSGIPSNGWYRLSPTDRNPTSFFASDALRASRATGISATLERYISQPKREVYDLSVVAPQSIEQYGEIEGRDLRVAVETRVDPAVFEERGCVIVQDPDDRRAEVELALQVLQRMGRKLILEAHRRNLASFRYKPKQGRPGAWQFLPVEIGDTISVTSNEVTVTGQVTAFEHTVDRKTGERWTDVTLAVSQVASTLSVTENWALPSPPSQYRLSETAQPTMTPNCPLPVDAAVADGESRIEPDGTVYVVTPSIDRRDVDEIVGTRAQQYSVSIPRNQFDVEVP